MLPFKTILFATDFSAASNVAFSVASALARDYRARIVAVHVIEPVKAGFAEFTSYIGPEEDKDKAREMLHALKAPGANAAIEYRLVEGDPADVIAVLAKDIGADLIVLGTHGRSGFTRLVMGSVAEEVLRHAPCPVLTVRGSAPIKEEERVDAPEAVAI